MKKEKGFTLIELLAVIVILAVIALIASPLIINIIESSRKKAFENSVYGVMSTYDIKISKEGNYKGITYNFPEGNSELLYSGTKMIGGSIFLTPPGSIEVRRITDGRYCASGNKTNLVIKRGDCTIDLAVAPVLKGAQGLTVNFLNTGIAKTTIESIEVIMVSEFPESAIDVSDKGNSGVMLWSKDENSNGMLEVYIGAIDDFVYANPNSSNLFSNMDNIYNMNLSNFDTITATNMNSMFYQTGFNTLNFTLDLGNNFDTSNVTNMDNMFSFVGGNSTKLILNLGDKFDTSNVINMNYMFSSVGLFSTNFTLDLGNKFNTSNVTNMNGMFSSMGVNSTSFTLDLGDKFDTSNVTNMNIMFYNTGRFSTNSVLILGNEFDTSKVEDMNSMFGGVGHNSTNFILELGNKFDTSNVTNMDNMFSFVGGNSTKLILNLGDKFDTSRVTSMNGLFSRVGQNASNFVLNLGAKFNVDNITDGTFIFYLTGSANPSFKPTASVKTQAEKDALLSKFPNIEVTIVP